MTMFETLDSDAFEHAYGGIRHSVFRVSTCFDSPFANSSWPILLLPRGELRLSEVDFFALAEAAKSVGDDRCVIAFAEEMSAEEHYAVVIPWDLPTFHSLRQETNLGILHAHLFGRSGKWGVVSYWDLCFCVGGDGEFLKTFIRKAGGEASLRDRFLEFVKEEWKQEWIIDVRSRERILALAGWSLKQ